MVNRSLYLHNWFIVVVSKFLTFAMIHFFTNFSIIDISTSAFSGILLSLMKNWVIESLSALFIYALKKVHFPFPLKLSTESHLVIQKKNGSTLHTSVPTNSISDTKWNQDTLGVTSFEYILGLGCSLQKVPHLHYWQGFNWEHLCLLNGLWCVWS